MESLFNIIKAKPKVETKSTKYKFQETALEIIKHLNLQGKDRGLVWALYKRRGEQALNSLLGEIKQGEVKGHPVKYIKYLLTNS